MAEIKGELGLYTGEISKFMEIRRNGGKSGSKEIKDVIIKVVNDIYDGKISPNALVELNNMIRNDFTLEKMFFKMIPASLLGHKAIFNNILESIDVPEDIDNYDKVQLLDILSKKSVGGLIDNEQQNQRRFPRISYVQFKQYNRLLLKKKEQLEEQCENEPELLENLGEIESSIEETEHNVTHNLYLKRKNRAVEQSPKNEQTVESNSELTELTQEESRMIEEINERMGSHDYQGTR